MRVGQKIYVQIHTKNESFAEPKPARRSEVDEEDEPKIEGA
jgi:hypothetical protein